MLIHIPFSPRFDTPMLQGWKTATTRTNKYGNPGDHFVIFEHTFSLIEVRYCYLYQVAKNCYRQEGFQTEQQFIAYWVLLHPGRGWQPNQKVYYHRFFLEK